MWSMTQKRKIRQLVAQGVQRTPAGRALGYGDDAEAASSSAEKPEGPASPQWAKKNE